MKYFRDLWAFDEMHRKLNILGIYGLLMCCIETKYFRDLWAFNEILGIFGVLICCIEIN